MKIVCNYIGRDTMRTRKGFTLVELMIVVAIISILTAIAVPSYQRYILRTHRKEAMSALQGLAQVMERYYVQTQPNSYVGAAVGGNPTGAPANFSATSPIDGGVARYNLLITAATATTYTLQAQPVNPGPQASDGIIQLNSTGQRAWDKNNDGAFGASEFTWND